MTCIVDDDDEDEHTHFYVSEVLGLYCCFFVLFVLALFYVTFLW